MVPNKRGRISALNPKSGNYVWMSEGENDAKDVEGRVLSKVSDRGNG